MEVGDNFFVCPGSSTNSWRSEMTLEFHLSPTLYETPGLFERKKRKKNSNWNYPHPILDTGGSPHISPWTLFLSPL